MIKSTIPHTANTQHKQVNFSGQSLQQILKVHFQLKTKERTIYTIMTKSWTTSILLLKRLIEEIDQALGIIKLLISIWTANLRWALSKLIKIREAVQICWAKGMWIMIMKMLHNQQIKICSSGKTLMTNQPKSLLLVLRTCQSQP